jgi:hypothetical protein
LKDGWKSRVEKSPAGQKKRLDPGYAAGEAAVVLEGAKLGSFFVGMLDLTPPFRAFPLFMSTV